MNLDFTYDQVSDKALLLRTYPYPFNNTGGVPCSGVCPTGPATFPMRGQAYSQKVNGNVPGLLTGTWKLEADIGRPTGWSVVTNGVCSPYPANDPFQTQIGVDMDSLNLHKTTNGFVSRTPSGSFTFLYRRVAKSPAVVQ